MQLPVIPRSPTAPVSAGRAVLVDAPPEAPAGRTVRKAVIPAAGLGTRFLPATKAVPKEMLPLVDAPAIQYVVEEAVAAGITDILLVTSPHKKAVEDHFDRAFELEARLAERGRHDEVAELRRLADLARVHTLRQGEPLGLGHAVHVARHHVGDEPFAVLLPDDLLVDGGALLRRLVATTVQTDRSSVALLAVPPEDIGAYGCAVPVRAAADGDVLPLAGLVEKPAPDRAPSDLAVIGRYVFTPSIFRHLDGLGPGAGGEIQLTDAMDRLARAEGLAGVRCTGGRYDVGAKLDYLRATVDLALRRPDIGPAFARYLTEVVRRGVDGTGTGGPPLASGA